jgi:hypothetical protein
MGHTDDPPPSALTGTYPHAIRFTASQRRELRQLGVPDVAIEVIEVEALPRARRALVRPAPILEVREELVRAEAAVREAHKALEDLLVSSDLPSRRDARRYINGGGARHLFDGIDLNNASKALVPAQQVLARAIARLPNEPVRHKTAADLPVEFIHDALQTGCSYSGMPFEHQKGRRRGLSLVAPKFRPSASPTSPFRQIVGICYERIGMPASDPERAIKSYVKRWTEFTDSLAREIRGTEPPPET